MGLKTLRADSNQKRKDLNGELDDLLGICEVVLATWPLVEGQISTGDDE